MSNHLIEARLSDELRADIVFSHRPAHAPSEDDPVEQAEDVEIIDILPIGCLPPMSAAELRKLAARWLDNGGWDACCVIAERTYGNGGSE